MNSIVAVTCFPRTELYVYGGRLSHTENGLSCQRWDEQSPQSHTYTMSYMFPDDTVTDAANFCRSPDGSDIPWCYTVDPAARWEYCAVHELYTSKLKVKKLLTIGEVEDTNWT